MIQTAIITGASGSIGGAIARRFSKAGYSLVLTGYQSRENLERTKKGYIKVDDEYKTSITKVFAGGDIIGQKATVAFAAKAGRDAAFEIAKFFNN